MTTVPTIDAFTHSYLATALWSSTDDHEEPLDTNYGLDDFSPETIRQAIEDCAAFQAAHWDDIAEDLERAGHDFWLTRNRHGAGFWDGDWANDVGQRLTVDAHAYGSVDLYVGDDGMVYAN